MSDECQVVEHFEYCARAVVESVQKGNAFRAGYWLGQADATIGDIEAGELYEAAHLLYEAVESMAERRFGVLVGSAQPGAGA